MQKPSLNQQKEIIRKDPFVYAPFCNRTKELLSNLNTSESYIQRGEGFAITFLKDLESKVRQWYSPIIDLKAFPHFYLTAGSTESLNLWRLSDSRPWQHLPGEYQYPQMLTKDGHVTELSSLSSERVLYLSNPSAANGNYLDNSDIDKINDLGCPIILDCSYLGAVREGFIGHIPKVEQIFLSLSKGWGLTGLRLGMLFTKYPHPILGKLKRVECWNYHSARVIDSILSTFKIDEKYQENKEKQRKICEALSLSPSDTYFIGNSTRKEDRCAARDNKTARLCLTKLWDLY